MADQVRRDRLRIARNLAVSAFVVFHLGATTVWILPSCPIREWAVGRVQYYVLPLGMWHYWGMFAPDPVKETLTLEAEVVDAQGLHHRYDFPKLADYRGLASVPRFRHPKLVVNLAEPGLTFARELAARHAVRQLKLVDAAFPLSVRLVYQVRMPSPPGGPPADPSTPPFPYLLGTFEFANRPATGGRP